MSEAISPPEHLPAHLQRVHTEHAELCIRLGKLEDFLSPRGVAEAQAQERPSSNDLPVEELTRLRRQATYMRLYAEVLSERMAAWQAQHQEA